MMRRDHRPIAWQRLSRRISQWYIRRFLRPQLDECGEGLEIVGPQYVSISGANILLGRHVHMMALSDAPIRLAVFEGMGRVEVGNHVLINPGVRLVSASAIEIGDNCMLAMHCHLSDADWHDTSHRIFAPGNTAPIKLGCNVWLGDSVKVLKGVSIGDNTIVGAGAVVTKDLPANVVAGGNPAVVLQSLPEGGQTTTREALFTMEESYADFADRFVSERLQGNTLVDWLRSWVAPNKKD
jgi:acetyltransferase-like isoleucine patch superfamily enzyme